MSQSVRCLCLPAVLPRCRRGRVGVVGTRIAIRIAKQPLAAAAVSPAGLDVIGHATARQPILRGGAMLIAAFLTGLAYRKNFRNNDKRAHSENGKVPWRYACVHGPSLSESTSPARRQTEQRGRNTMPITRRSLTFGMPLSAAASVMTRHARGADTSPILIGYPAALTGPSSAPGVGQESRRDLHR